MNGSCCPPDLMDDLLQKLRGNSAGITRFQLATKRASATERILLRQMPGAKPGAPMPEEGAFKTKLGRGLERRVQS